MLHPDMPYKEFLRMHVAMFQTYLDESGIEKTDVCTVAGFVGGIQAQGLFGKKWKKILEHYDVRVPFHSIQFYAPPEKIMKSTTNPYRGWSNTKRKRFINDLITAIEEHNIFLVGCGIDSIAFHNRTQEEKRYMTGGIFHAMSRKWYSQGKPSAPYFVALRATIEIAAYRITKAEASQKPMLTFFMSEQNNYERGAMQMYRNILDMQPPLDVRHVLAEPMVFETPKNMAQLQAADLAAYHTYQYSRERRTDINSLGSPTFRRLAKCAAHSEDLKFISQDVIDKIGSRFAERRDEAEVNRHLRLTRLRVKASHEPAECKIIGTVDEAGNFLPSAPST